MAFNYFMYQLLHAYSANDSNHLFTCHDFFLSGSGKTAAFLIPILSRIFEEGPPPMPDVSNF